MVPVALTSIGLIAVLVLVVVGSMVVENWHRLRVQTRVPRRTGTPVPAVDLVPQQLVEQVSAGPGGSARDPAPASESPLLASSADATDLDRFDTPSAPPEVLHVLEGRVVADQLVAALFAAYAASRGREAGRAAAWVCAIDRPTGASGIEFEPGADLRGKPAAAARLLSCRAQGRCWVTLQPSVDIARGLVRRAPSSETLAGLTTLWSATRAAMTELPGEDLPMVAAAITTLEPQWRGTTAAPWVLDLLVACTEAQDLGIGLRLQVTKAPFGPLGATVAAAAPDTDQDSAPSSTSQVGQTV